MRWITELPPFLFSPEVRHTVTDVHPRHFVVVKVMEVVMTIFWMFNEDACTFERCDQQTALDAIDKEVPVIIRDDDVRVYMDGKFRR